MMGKVYLVGAGPGNPGLITVRGKELLEQADCVVYDRLVSPELLNITKADCEKIYVGKKNHHHTMKQEDINALLVEKAKGKKCIVRLKGGDPYVFGRGGEEALELIENGISFEVVPGVTSAVAGAAAAGIPVTHRGLAGGFHVVTAHNRKDELADIDFTALAKGKETCIFLMGLSKLGEIAKRLMAAGMSGETEAAVVSHATTREQQVCQAPLEEIEEKVREDGISSPALIIVGAVVGLRSQLATPPAKKCLVPKIGREPGRLAKLLREYGILTEEITVGEIVYLDWLEKEKGEIKRESHPDWLVFTSRNGVRGFFYGLQSAGADIRNFSGCRIAAIGKKTVVELQKYGIQTDLIPPRSDSVSLAEALKKEVTQGTKIWYLKALNAPNRWKDKLGELCQVEEKNVYKNQKVEIPHEIDFSDYDGVAFTCGSSVERIFAAREGTESETSGVKLFSIGPACTGVLKAKNGHEIYEAETASYEKLAELIKRELGR